MNAEAQKLLRFIPQEISSEAYENQPMSQLQIPS